MTRATKKIGDVCQLVNGRAFKPSDWTKEGLRIIRIQNLNNEDAPFNCYNGNYLHKHLIGDGDVLLSWSGTPGTSFGCFIWNRGQAILNQHIFKVHVDEEVYDKEYFVFAVNSELGEMIHQAHGAVGLRHITKGRLEEMDIPHVEKKEQRRVVSRIRECLNRIAEMELLHGELVGENSSLESSFVNDFLSSSTVSKARRVTLGTILKRAQYGTSQKADADSSATPMLRMGNIQRGRVVATNGLKYAKLSADDLNAYRLNEGDILFNRTNSFELVGKSGVFTGLRGDWVFASYLIRLIADRESVLPEFVSTLINSSLGRSFIEANARRAIGQVNINAKQIARFEIPALSLAEQKSFVDKLTEVRQASDQIAEESTNTEFIHLRESILREAFTGNL